MFAKKTKEIYSKVNPAPLSLSENLERNIAALQQLKKDFKAAQTTHKELVCLLNNLAIKLNDTGKNQEFTETNDFGSIILTTQENSLHDPHARTFFLSLVPGDRYLFMQAGEVGDGYYFSGNKINIISSICEQTPGYTPNQKCSIYAQIPLADRTIDEIKETLTNMVDALKQYNEQALGVSV